MDDLRWNKRLRKQLKMKKNILKRLCHIYVKYYWKKLLMKHTIGITWRTFSLVKCGIQFIYSYKLHMTSTNFDFVSAIFDAMSEVKNCLVSKLFLKRDSRDRQRLMLTYRNPMKPGYVKWLPEWISGYGWRLLRFKISLLKKLFQYLPILPNLYQKKLFQYLANKYKYDLILVIRLYLIV